MATDTLARMFWDRVEKSADRPAQSFKQGAGWKTITWREVGDVVEVIVGQQILLQAVMFPRGQRAEEELSYRGQW